MFIRRHVSSFVAAVLIGALAFNASAATTRHVTSSADSGANTLRAQIAAAVSGDTIDFVGLPTPATILLTTGTISWTGKNLTITGPGANLLSISGNHTTGTTGSRAFFITSSTTVISGITFTNCFTSLANTVVAGYNDGGAIEVDNSLATTNSTTVNNCVFSANFADWGGALDVFAGPVTISGCTFVNNSATGIDVSGSTNLTPGGGGALSIGYINSNTTITNTTFYLNKLTGASGLVQGGAIDFYGDNSPSTTTATITNCTFVGNTDASGKCSCIMIGQGSSEAVNLTIKNSIFSGNLAGGVLKNCFINASAGGSHGSIVTGGGNVIDEGGGSATATAGFMTGTNDKILNATIAGSLSALANNGGGVSTIAISAGSPARANGVVAGAPTVDARGATRASPPDSGAFQFLNALTISTASLPNATVGTAYNQTLTATGGAGGNVWSLSVGTLPSPLLLNSNTGAIAGTPSAAGTSNFTVLLTDSIGITTTKALSITVTSSTPTITTSTAGPLTLGTVTAGLAGTAQSFTVGGTNLTANLVVTAPTGVEVSTTSGSGYSSSVSLTPTTGTVATTTIFARIASTASAGAISGNIACTSTGATTQNVSVSGTVNAGSLVVTNANDTGAGSLRAAVGFANTTSGSTVTFDPTFFATAQTITLTTGQIAISNNITITGPGARLVTVSGNNASRIFLVNDNDTASNKNVIITDMTLSQGNGLGDITLGSGSPLTQGGAIYSTENLTLRRCTISGNSVNGPHSGVSFNGATTATTNVVDACTISGNTVTAAGSNAGGIFVGGSTNLTVTNTTISGNTVGNSGGGVLVQAGGTATFTNCTIVGNTASGSNGGGGLRATGTGTSITLKNTIVAGNVCTGLAAGNDLTANSPATITGNNNVIGDAGSSGGLTNGTSGNIVGVSGSGIRTLSTIISATLANNGGPTNTHALAAGSVAIDAGNNTDATGISFDQRGTGFARVANTTVDIGAFENGSGPADYAVTTTSTTITVTNSANNSDTIAISEPSAGNILFTVAGRSFSVNGGANISGSSGNLSLSGITSVTFNTGTGSEVTNMGAFTSSFPSLTIQGTVGNHTVNFNGNLTFASNANLLVDFQTGNATPGADAANVASNVTLALSGTGTATMKVSQTVVLNSGATLSVVNGAMDLEGNRQASATSGNFSGIFLNGGSLVSTGSGNILCLGTGGNAAQLDQTGIRLSSGTITSSGTGTITLTGNGGAGGASNSRGVDINISSSITSVSGQIQITGTGGNATSGLNHGVTVINSSVVSTSGSANIVIAGTAGSNIGTTNNGINMATSGVVQTTGTGTIQLTGTSSEVASSVDINMADDAGTKIQTAGTGLTLIGDYITVGTTNPAINAGTGTVTIRQRTNAVTINLGGSSGAGNLGLTDSVLDQVTAGTLQIGDANSGAISISAVISPASYTTLATGNNTTFTATGGFSSLVTSATVFQKVSVTGTVTITAGATLSVASTGGFVASGGQTYTILTNDAAEAITGTFTGPTLTNFLGSTLTATQSYTGGTGNDLVFSLPVTTFVVTTNADSGAGSLRTAITSANAAPGSTITFDPTVFATPQTITLASALPTINANMTITGPGVAKVTVSGNSTVRPFSIAASNLNVSITDMTIANGLSPSTGITDGGGMLNQSTGTVTLANVLFTANTTGSSGSGGGICHRTTGTMNLTNCLFAGNSCTSGGGGGGIFNSTTGTITAVNCTFSGNTITGNLGGGVDNFGTGTITLTNCTVTGNTATNGGGVNTNGGTLSITNTIVAGNTGTTSGPDVRGTFTSLGNNLIGNTATGSGFVASDLQNIASPRLGTLGSYGGALQTVPLLPGSPAINAGTATGSPATDARGIARVGAVDIGAFEAQAFTLTLGSGNNQSTAGGSAFTNPLVVNVTGTGGDPINGGAVTFTAPGSGASLNSVTQTATITSGAASLTATANATAGGPYTVAATATGASPTINFSLTNTAANIVVTTNADSGAGSLRTAITTANATTGATITFQSPPFDTAQTITLASALPTITSNMTITGPGSNLCTVNGNALFRGFNIGAGTTVSISGLTVNNGSNAGQGGGIQNSGTLTLTNVVVTNCSAPQGGGIENDATLTMNNCTVSGNSAPSSGAGLTIFGSSTTLTNCTFVNNSGSATGAVDDEGTGSVTLTNCSIVNNNSIGVVYATANTITLKNTIVIGNTTSDVIGTGNVVATSSFNLIGPSSGGLTNGVNNNQVGVTVANAILGTLGAYPAGSVPTVPLLPGSPAINAGTATGAPATDARGVARVGTTDIGAFEAQAFTLALTSGNNQSASVGTAFASPLIVTVTGTGNDPVNNGRVTFTGPVSGASINPNTVGAPIGANSSGTAQLFPQASTTIGGPYTVSATATGASPTINFSLTNTVGAAAKLAFVQQPTNAVSGAAISPAVTVQVQDSFGNLVTSTASVTIAIGTNPSGGTLSGTATVNAVGGVATFSGLNIDKVGTGYTLSATSTGLTSATSSAFNITPGAAAKLAFAQQPTNAVSATNISPAVTVQIQDAAGNLTTSTASVTIAIGTNPSGGTLSGTATVNAVAGVATFSTLKIDKAGTGYTLSATSTGLTTATSSAFNITAGAAAKLAFAQQPTNTVSATNISPAVTVQIQDAAGNLTASTASVTIAIGTNPSGGTLSGTTTVNAVAGVATFSTLNIDKAGTGYTLSASSTGLTSATSSAFNITAGAAAKLAYSVQPSNTVSGAAITPSVTVQIQDAAGNLTTSTASVTIAIGTNPSGGTLSGTATVNAVAGVATFSTLNIDKVGTGYTLIASSTGLTSATSSAFNITPGAAASLAFAQQPTNTVSATNISPAVTVNILDAAGNLTTSTASVTIAIGTNPGGGTLSGTVTANAVAGVATFSTLKIDKAGTGYTLSATSTGLTTATSSAFNITAGAAAKLAFAQQPTNTVSATNISPAVTVQIQDAAGNLTASTASVTIAIGTNPSGGTLSGTATVNAVAGVATFSTLNIDKAGTGYTLSASSTGLTSATSSAFNITAGAAAKLAYSVQPSNTVSGAAITPSVTVQIQDAAGNLTTSTASVTIAIGTNPGGGTLSGTATVNAVAGVATFSTLNIDKVGTGYTLSASSTGLTSATSSAFNITPGAAASLAFVQQPTNTVSATNISPAVTVNILDAAGNLTTSTASVTIAIGTNPSGGTLSGTATVNAVAGVATFSTLKIDKAGVGYTLSATSTGLTSATSSAFNITAGAAAKLAFAQQPTNTVSATNISPAVTVQIQDAAGNLTTSTASVTLAIGTNPGGGTLSGTVTVNAVAGIATFSTLNIDKAGTGYTLSASSTGLTSATSSAFNITAGAAAKLAFVQQPTSAVSNVAISPAVTVQIQDAAGNLTTSTASVTLAIGTNPGGGTLSGTVTVNAVAGVATFSTLKIDKTGTGYTLSASSTGLTSATSSTFNITPGAPASLAFAQQPTNTVSAVNISPAVTVNILDAAGNLTTSTASVTIAIGTNPSGGALNGTATVNAVAGVATFSTLNIDKTGTGYTLSASSTGLTGATSSSFNITVAGPAKLAFSVQPTNTVSATNISPAVTVQILDAAGNLTASTASVTIAIGTNPGGGTLGGTVTVNAVAGVATFSTLNIDKAGTGYTLSASSTGLTSATSSAFNITAGAAAKLAFVQQPTSAVSNVAISPALTVQIQDAAGNLTSSTASVTLAIGTNPGGGTLSGTVTVNAVGGVATFSTLKIDKTGTGYTLSASSTGLTSATSSAFNITPGAPASLAFAQQPTNTVSAVNISPAVTVQILDAAGNLTTSTASVTIAIGTNPGGGTLSGTATVNAVAGVATFSTLKIDKAGTGYTLSASSTGLTSATSSAFNITAGAAAKLAFAQQPTNAVSATNISPAVTVQIQDAAGNLTSSTASVTMAIGTNPSGGTLGGTVTVNAVAGVATFSTLNIDKAGTGYTLTASSTGLTGATSSTFNITAGAAAKLAFVQQPTSAVSNVAISPAVTVQIQDAAGNLTSSTASVTMAIGTNPGGGTLSGTVTVNAVGGVATFSTLNIDKAGTGYTLSASSTGLTSATSSAFNITPGAPASLAFAQQPTNTVSAVNISPAVTIQILDAAGNLTTSTASVTIAVGTNPGGGTLSGTATVNAVAGVATFSTLNINKTGTGYTLTASSTGLTGATSSAFNITPGAAASLAFAQQPTDAVSSVAIAPAITVRILDASGNLTTSTASVTMAINTNPNSGTLSGTATVSAVAGVATFSTLNIDKAGAGYTLDATSTGLTGATSASFLITNGPPATIVTSAGATQQSTVSTAFPTLFAATVTDAAGNVVPGATVTFTAPSSGASGTFANSTTTTAAQTDKNGIATATVFTANATAGGPYNVAASVTGVSTPANFALTNNAAIAFNPTTIADVTANVPFSLTINALNGTGNKTLSLNGTFNDGGSGLAAPVLTANTATFSSTPNAGGTVTFTLTATDTVGATAVLAYSFKVNPLQITTTSLPGSQLYINYNQPINVISAPQAALTFSVFSGTFPPGLNLNTTTGQITGAPTQTGVFAFTLKVADTFGGSTTQAYSVTMTAPTIVMGVTSIPNGKVGVPYPAQQLTASGGLPNGAYTFAVAPGSTIAPGLTLSSSGAITGTPTGSGNYNFVIIATDSTTVGNGGPFSTTRNYFVNMAAPTLGFTLTQLVNGNVGTNYTQQILTTGGTAPYSFTMTAGSLPPGLSLSPNGMISGTPTTEGTYNFTLMATDSSTASTNQQPTQNVAPAPGATTGSGPFSSTVNYSIFVDYKPVFVSPPAASMSQTPNIIATTLVTDLTSQFSAIVGPSDAIITWNFGDGTSSSSGPNVDHTYTADGTYTVMVTATNPRTNTSATTSLVVTVTSGSTLPGTNAFRLRDGAIALSASKNRIDLHGIIHLQPNEKIAGGTLTVSVNGATRTFTLDGKGKAKSANGTALVVFKLANNVLNSQEGPLVVSMTGADIAAGIKAGVSTNTAGNPTKAIVLVTLNGRTLSFVSPLTFKSSTKATVSKFGLH